MQTEIESKQESRKKITLVKGFINEENSVNQKDPIFVESIVLGNEPAFMIAGVAARGFGLIMPRSQIELKDKILIAATPDDYPYTPYKFANINELENKVDFNELYARVYTEVDRHIDVEEEFKYYITACIMFTYKQDKSNTTPYPFFVGDNESGKSTVLHLMKNLAYRPMLSESLPYADVYNFLGTQEEASGIILEDEAQDLDNDKEKMKIYKGSYVKGSRIPRVKDTINGTKQVFYHGYCFKAFAGEKLPHNKGFLQRSIIISMVEGYPQGNIKDLKPEDMERLSKLRNELLLWRMQTLNQELPDIEIDFLKNRDAEIWKPILRIVHGSKYYDNLLALCRKQVEKRRRDKGDTLEAVIFGIVKQLTAKNPEIAFEEVWSKVREEPGQDDAKNPQAYILQDHGKVTKTYIGKILTEKFKGVKDREGNKRIYRFDAKIITKLERKYGSHGSHGSSNEEEAKTTSEIGSNHEGNVIKNDQPDLSKTIQTIQTVHVNDALTVEGSEFRVKRIEGNLHTIKCLVCNDTPTIRADNRQELEKKLRTHIDLFHIGGRTN